MNSSAACHEIEGVPNLYVDAFRGAYLQKTHFSDHTFILSHYHGDHYQSLPRDDKYQGPALIHCTHVTAALLTNVHKIPSQFVIPHEYGVSWTYSWSAKGENKTETAAITFYDANHCPGAAIITIQLPCGKTHLHTGDMRYHPKMKMYPVLKDAVDNRNLDLLYLDTTYGHKKHNFLSQDVAVDQIATQIQQLLPPKERKKDTNVPKVLILLSCYSIGKEKVLWEASQRTNQLVYVTDRKMAMMECISQTTGQSIGEQDTTIQQPSTTATATASTPVTGSDRPEDEHVLPCHQIMERCTRDPNATCLHVIPMGTAGELWPYFRPNYRACVDYAETLDTNYDKVVAFLPTGWADGSNWNKKNAISKKQLDCQQSQRRMDVEIRLIPYSEHSTYSELIEFVQYCRPRQVIPTVFKDNADKRRLEQLFRLYVDSSRAKLNFFQGMLPKGGSGSTKSVVASPQKPLSGDSSLSESSKKATTTTQDNSNVKETTIKTEVIARLPPPAAAAQNNDNSCIDLTFSSSEDEDEGTASSCTNRRPATQNTTLAAHARESEQASSHTKDPPLRPNNPSFLSGSGAHSQTITPAKKRKRPPSSTSTTSKDKDKGMTQQPLISRFFAVQKQRQSK